MLPTLHEALITDKPIENEKILYEKHILDAEKRRECAQAHARAEHQTKSVDRVYARTVEEATNRYLRQCERLKQSMMEEISNELKSLRDNRDGVSLTRKGFARSARASRSSLTYDENNMQSESNTQTSLQEKFTPINTIPESPIATSTSTKQKNQSRLRFGDLSCIVGPISTDEMEHDKKMIQENIAHIHESRQ